jgi:hypothetical protein
MEIGDEIKIVVHEAEEGGFWAESPGYSRLRGARR